LSFFGFTEKKLPNQFSQNLAEGDTSPLGHGKPLDFAGNPDRVTFL